jgi:hypothetical protein
MTGIPQQQCGDGRVDATRQRDDRAAHVTPGASASCGSSSGAS